MKLFRRRFPSSPFAAVLIGSLGLALSVLSAPGAAKDCAAWPGADAAEPRLGRDDVFVFVDSSLSMGPRSFGSWATGYMAEARSLLRELVDCHLREGDFVLVSTFDSEARIEIAKEVRSPRDLETLRLQIDALEPTRARYYRGLEGGRPIAEATPPVPGRPAVGTVLGGSWKTDLGAMTDLAIRLLRDHSDADHRQIVLFFTDGAHDPPSFSPFDEPVGLDAVLDEELLARRNLQIGVVRVPSVADADADADRDILRRLVEQLDPDGRWRRGGSLALLEPAGDDPSRSFAAGLAELLRLRLVLAGPPEIDLEQSVRPRIGHRLEIRNETRLDRQVEIAAARFEGADGARLVLDVEPALLELAAGETAELRISGDLDSSGLGELDGSLVIDFAGPVGFHPRRVPVRGEHLSWWAEHGWMAGLALAFVPIALAAFVAWRRRPQWIALLWTDGDVVRASRPRRIGVGQGMKFGDRGMGGLAVDGPESRLGEVRREGVDEYVFAFDHLYLDTDSSGPEPFRRADMASWEPVPGSGGGESISFRRAHRKSRLERLLRHLVTTPRDDADEAGSSAWGAASRDDRWGF